MTQSKIEPHKVTKPMQLLAAWLVGLILTNGIFLLTAVQLDKGSWERGALIVAAIVNVPVFLYALFILQTRFRAELQADTYYAEYLSKKTDSVVRVEKTATYSDRIGDLEWKLLKLEAAPPPTFGAGGNAEATRATTADWSSWRVALHARHPRYVQVREALRAAGIPLADIYGEGSVPPDDWVISLSIYLPGENVVQLLRAVIPLGFDGFQFWEPQRDAEENEDVYIGSYGADSYAKLEAELFSLLDGRPELTELKFYERRHKVSRPKRAVTSGAAPLPASVDTPAR